MGAENEFNLGFERDSSVQHYTSALSLCDVSGESFQEYVYFNRIFINMIKRSLSEETRHSSDFFMVDNSSKSSEHDGSDRFVIKFLTSLVQD